MPEWLFTCVKRADGPEILGSLNLVKKDMLPVKKGRVKSLFEHEEFQLVNSLGLDAV